jgi:hypothetical protein
VLLVFLGLTLVPALARAQGSDAGGLNAALEETDRRIGIAETLVAASPDAQARAELAMARDLQSRARSAMSSGQQLMAGRLTTSARSHADRAIAIVRGLPDAGRVLAQVERTRDMLERAGERIAECEDDRARAGLRVALEMQGRAESAVSSGRLLGGLQLTMGARQRGLRALRLCRMEEDVEQEARRALQRTDEAITRARERMEAGPPGNRGSAGRGAVERAIALQADAYRQVEAGRHEAGLQLTLTARRIAHRAEWRGPRAR